MSIIIILTGLCILLYVLRYKYFYTSLIVYLVSLVSILIMYAHNFHFLYVFFIPQHIILATVLGCVCYVIEVAGFFMITKKALILDLGFYFKGKLPYLSFALSCIISILEELVWRQLLFYNQIDLLLPIGLSIIGFGLSHIVWGKHQVWLKSILGIVLTLIYLVSNDILFVILIHISYNYFMLKKQGKGSQLYGYKSN